MFNRKFIRFVEVRPNEYGYTHQRAVDASELETVIATVNGQDYEFQVPTGIKLHEFATMVDTVVPGRSRSHITHLSVDR